MTAAVLFEVLQAVAGVRMKEDVSEAIFVIDSLRIRKTLEELFEKYTRVLF